MSRPLLREALAELRAEGFVETISGRGTFVRHPTEADLAEAFSRQLRFTGSDDGPTADHLYEARRAIEVVAAGLAAKRATPDSLATLHKLLTAMRDSGGDAAAYTAADVGFHVAVARASQNPILPTLLAPLATMIVKGMFESHDTSHAVEHGIFAHAKVLQAIERGDAAAARRAMNAHLSQSRRVFPDGVAVTIQRRTDDTPRTTAHS